MSDNSLKQLSTAELLHVFRYKRYNMKEWAEIRRRLELAEQQRQEGAVEMLEMIRSSLRDYPNAGGDIEVMKEVDRIKAEQHECAARSVIEKVWAAWPDIRQLIEGWATTAPKDEWSDWDEDVRQETIALSFLLEKVHSTPCTPAPSLEQNEVYKISGMWRCLSCAETIPPLDLSWRWNGSAWEHKCGHSQQGHNAAQYFAALAPNDPVRVLQEQNAEGMPGPKIRIPNPREGDK